MDILFAGAAEVVGGLLLLWRRTVTLGGLVVVGVMSNVVMLNFCYDVPVKLYSSHLLLMAFFLLLPDARRLANVLVLNRPTEPVALRVPLPARWMERSRLGVKTLLIGWALYSTTHGSLEAYNQYAEGAPKPPLYGLYEVEEFSRNGQAVPPLLTETTRWRMLVVGRNSWLTLKLMDDKTERFRMEDDPEKRTLTLSLRRAPTVEDTSPKITLTYSQPDPKHLVLEGPFREESLTVRLRKVDLSKFLLVNRGFHWINEYPFNR